MTAVPGAALAAPSHRHVRRLCREFTDLRPPPVPLTNEGGVPYKPRDLNVPAIPTKAFFREAAFRHRLEKRDVGHPFGNTLHQAEKHP